MHYFLGKADKKVDKPISSDLTQLTKGALKKQFCQICDKLPAAKVAFGDGVKPAFTCANCELKAVGNSVQRMGQKNLISNDQFSEILTKEMISYQNSQKNHPPEQKKASDNIEGTRKKTDEISSAIREEFKRLKVTSKSKMEHLTEQSEKQNSVFVFEEVGKAIKENKLNQLDHGNLLLKRSLVNSKGLHFTDQDAIQSANSEINEKMNSLRKEAKVKLKEINDLIDEINGVEF